jgi:UPF0716 protein FxsA
VGLWLLLVFVGVPILEIVLFIKVGGAIGALPTVLLIIASAVIGVAVVRRQGMSTLDRLQRSLESGGDPTGPIAHGALILIAGILLLVPGFFTDAMGVLLLIPAVRERLIRRGAARVTVRATGFARRTPSRPPETIDVDYQVVDDGSDRRGNSGWTRPH